MSEVVCGVCSQVVVKNYTNFDDRTGEYVVCDKCRKKRSEQRYDGKCWLGKSPANIWESCGHHFCLSDLPASSW